MSSSHLRPADDVAPLIGYVQSHLIVRQLHAVLKAEQQPTSGLKTALVKRLTEHIEKLKDKNDLEGIDRVRQLVFHPDGPNTPSRLPASPAYSSANGYIPPRLNQPVFSSSPATAYGTTSSTANSSCTPTGISYPSCAPLTASLSDQLRVIFKESPFYTVLAPLSNLEKCPSMILFSFDGCDTDVLTVEAMTTNRHQVKATVLLSPAQVQQLNSDKTYRCMVYCAALDSLTGFTRDTEIAFPHSVELRVNGVQIQGLNLRGLKNKPGSTRPADVTDYLTKKPSYRNEVGLTYALTQKNFVFIVNLVKQESVENLVERLRNGKSIAKETVISDMVRNNEDADLVATSSIMSLKCPLSTLRISLPVRSTFCSHVQCFDATSFLQLQQQAPTWTCPTCNKSITFNALVVDRYFDDILRSTPRTVESVTIDVDGRWSVAAETSNSPVPESSDDEDDKDIVEISDNRRTSVNINGSASSASTPIISRTRDASSSSAGRIGSASSKRPISQVIDLTLSDDDELPRPSKRHTALPTPSSINSDVRGNGSTDLSGMGGFLSSGRSSIGTPDPFQSRKTYK